MSASLRAFDPAEYIDTPEATAEYLTSALESGDSTVISDAIGVIARAKGMSQLARDTGLSRQALYKSLSAGGHPELETVLKVLAALGVGLTVKMLETAEIASAID